MVIILLTVATEITKLVAKAQRLLNALEPGTVIPIHRHRHTAETYIVLRRSINVIFYDDNKVPVDHFALSPQTGAYGLHIPADQCHTLEVLESGTVIFEVKDGPYEKLGEGDVL